MDIDPTTYNAIGFTLYVAMIITFVVTRNTYIGAALFIFSAIGLLSYFTNTSDSLPPIE